jgi:hypothetical protein
MSKIPYVERPPGYTTGLTGECAYAWAVFLMNEADMNEDYLEYDTWKAAVESLKPAEGKPVAAIIHYAKLEEALEKYGFC